MIRIIYMIYLFIIVGCGGGNSPLNIADVPAEAPAEVVSADIISADIQYMYESHLYASQLHFLLNVRALNTGTANLRNVYYRIEGMTKYWFTPDGFSLIAVTAPFDIYRGAELSHSIEFTHISSEVYLVVGSVYPREYPMKVVLCTAAGEPLGVAYITVLIP